jgi:uncharacterized protein YerC
MPIRTAQTEIDGRENKRCIVTVLWHFWKKTKSDEISTQKLYRCTKLLTNAHHTSLSWSLLTAKVLNFYWVITRLLYLNMKQASQETLVQAISLLKQGKSVREVEGVAGSSKSTVGRLRKHHYFGLGKPKGGQHKILSALMNVIVCVKCPKTACLVHQRWLKN